MRKIECAWMEHTRQSKVFKITDYCLEWKGGVIALILSFLTLPNPADKVY